MCCLFSLHSLPSGGVGWTGWIEVDEGLLTLYGLDFMSIVNIGKPSSELLLCGRRRRWWCCCRWAACLQGMTLYVRRSSGDEYTQVAIEGECAWGLDWGLNLISEIKAEERHCGGGGGGL